MEAAHIVPYSLKGKDDIWNGLALCHLHHWAFDVGWFTLLEDFTIQVSSRVNPLPNSFGRLGEIDFIRLFSIKKSKLILPLQKEFFPHENALKWHRENRFYE